MKWAIGFGALTAIAGCAEFGFTLHRFIECLVFGTTVAWAFGAWCKHHDAKNGTRKPRYMVENGDGTFTPRW